MLRAEPEHTRDDGVKPCTKCRRELPLPGQRWGRACFREYRRLWRQRNRLMPSSPPLVRVIIRNPANQVGIFVGTTRIMSFVGPAVLEAVTAVDAEALRQLAKRFPMWTRLG